MNCHGVPHHTSSGKARRYGPKLASPNDSIDLLSYNTNNNNNSNNNNNNNNNNNCIITTITFTLKQLHYSLSTSMRDRR